MQKQYVQKVIENPLYAYLLFLEHPPTLTMGYRMDEKDATKEITFFKNKNYDIVRSERGGLLTLHNPGQLLCYPIVNLRSLGIGAHQWIEQNLLCIQQVLQSFSVPSFYKMDSVGVFTEKGKITSMGFRIKAGISTHGFAINVRNDLRDFYEFNPCGLCQAGVSSIENYVPQITMQEVADKITENFKIRNLRIGQVNLGPQ